MKDTIEEKQRGCAADKELLKPLFEKEDAGEVTLEDEKEMDRL